MEEGIMQSVCHIILLQLMLQNFELRLCIFNDGNNNRKGLVTVVFGQWFFHFNYVCAIVKKLLTFHGFK